MRCSHQWSCTPSVRAHAAAGAAVVVVGVVADALSVATRVAELYGIRNELVVEESWRFLGFDVADAPDGISGLCNCGYSEAEHTALAGLFGSQLNPHGLFHDAASALRFRDVADTRVSAHAPFDVYGLWRVDP
jgi:hypothetical protein